MTGASSIYTALHDAAQGEPSLRRWLGQMGAAPVLEVIEDARDIVLAAANEPHIAALRQRVEAAKRRAEEAKAEFQSLLNSIRAMEQEVTRLEGTLANARATTEDLKRRVAADTAAAAARGTGGAPRFTADDAAKIRAALRSTSVTEVDRTEAMKALNAFIDRATPRQNPGRVQAITDEAIRLQAEYDNAEFETRGAVEARRAYGPRSAAILARVAALKEQIATVEQMNAAMRETIRLSGGGATGGGEMTKSEQRTLQLALHPDQKPNAERMKAALDIFEAYVARTGGTTSTGGSARGGTRPGAGRGGRAGAGWGAGAGAGGRSSWTGDPGDDAYRRAEERAARERAEREARAERDRARTATGEAAWEAWRNNYSATLAARLKAGNFKAGDILYCSFGYNMTIVNFYEVVATSGKTVVVLSGLATQTLTGDARYQGTIIPDPRRIRVGELLNKRTTTSGGSIRVKLTDSQRAYLWDGKAKYFNRID